MKNLIIVAFLILNFKVYSQSNWQMVNFSQQYFVQKVAFQDSTTGYALAQNKILKSEDAGDTWNIFYEDTTIANWLGIAITPDSLFLFALDSINSFQSYLINKNDTNYTKRYESHGNQNSFMNMKYHNGKVWYNSIGTGLLTYENGITDTIISNTKAYRIHKGNICAATNTVLYLSDDNGNTWDTIPNPIQSNDNIDCFYAGGDTIIYYGYGSQIFYLYTHNKGGTWNAKSSLVNHPNSQFSFFDKDKLLGTAHSNQNIFIYSSSDGGISFNNEFVNRHLTLMNTYIYNENLAFAHGLGGTIYKSTNGGGMVGLMSNEIPSNSFKIYPNPTKDFLHIEVLDERKIKGIEIYSIDGRLVKSVATFKNNIDISSLVSGEYLIKLLTEEDNLSKVFIIEE